MQQLYEEAHAYLSSAGALQHAEAKRLHGLCYINAWGVPEDKEHGFKLVVESIELEQSWDKVPQIFASIGLNSGLFKPMDAKSWDKVPQIFASIGLNKPEFFSAFTKMRGDK